MFSHLAAHANTVLGGLIGGAAYYFAARAMEVAALRLSDRRRVAAVLAAFVLRLGVGGALVIGLVTWTRLDARALCFGALTGYTIVLGGEAAGHVRRLLGHSAAAAGRRETAHGR